MIMENDAVKVITGEYSRDIWSKIRKGIKEYELIQDGDRIAVCISGGKDSMLMAKCLQMLSRLPDMNFGLEYIVMDPGYRPEIRQKIEDNAKKLELPVKFYETKIFESVENEPKNPCFLCARLRRGWLYKKAEELGCSKIALGHHFDDVIETILMGMLYGSQIQTMMPKLHSENYSGMELIRPLYLVREGSIISWAEHCGLEFIQCACRMTERDAESHTSKRSKVKEMLRQLRET